MKERLLLKQHEVTGFGLMLGYIGVLLMLIGGIVLLPLLTLLWYPEEAYEAKYFILPAICYSIISGEEKQDGSSAIRTPLSL